MDLYIHSPIRLHGVVLNSLSRATTFTFYTLCIFGVEHTGCFISEGISVDAAAAMQLAERRAHFVDLSFK
jgi:hypothetical protein